MKSGLTGFRLLFKEEPEMPEMRIEKGKIVKGAMPRFPDLEEGMEILAAKIKEWAPTPPDEGPPLPRVIEIKWPRWLSKRLPKIFPPD